MRPAFVAIAMLGIAACTQQRAPRPDPRLVARGRELAATRACASCHSTNGAPRVGPTWKGVYMSRLQLDDGTYVVADDAYLRESIAEPDAKTVKGFSKGVMSNVIKAGSIPPDEVDALVAYIKSLK